ncbi:MULTISPECIES: AMP-binding protein [Pseudonocardia]|uniref:Bile acid-coenzyme A ligase n=2 Tax=Pseudonocardia TaxID=1847 RepID=A0A1Y2MH49_PSEAH|nr:MULTISPECIES: AMP-binding protein [Pseudonocardia]OSY34604.1 Bile acid-coenzyme A ligase [Pseudonocardia autotrophica]TDN74700.1 long-chain acyl-CoA synthetase [Pseudonocardia autotrophica]BBG05473.1 long-chain acyl-CoA synthetase [Pseudonocardia autotrophica]GEC29394.1 long-chain acyl-CoA synthetase [Pseudonocardia saturnea]
MDRSKLGFHRVADAHPDRIALIADSTAVSFAVLAEQVNRVSNGLRALGLAEGDAVVAMVGNGVAYFELVLATAQSGLYLVPVDTHSSPREVRYICADSRAAVLVADAALGERLASAAVDLPVRRFAVGGAVIGWSDYAELSAGRSSERPARRVAGALMPYTSGTTGRPKGVRRKLTGQNPDDVAAELTAARATLFRLCSDDPDSPADGVHLACSPLYHNAPGVYSQIALHLGHTVVGLRKFDPVVVLQAIERHRVTWTHMVPTHFRRMLDLPADQRASFDVSSLRTVLHAGARCPVDVKAAMLDWVGPVVWEYYGATEGMVSVLPPEEWPVKRGSVGRPAPGVTVRILDDASATTPIGQVGSIYFSVPAPFEYLGDPEKTERSRSGDLVTAGDLGSLDDDGYLFLHDRRSDLIISGGVNIYPAEIEACLVRHAHVRDAAVVGVPDEQWGQRVVAVIERAPGADATNDETVAEDLRALCARDLASYKVPKELLFRDALPRSEAGKLDRNGIRTSAEFLAAAQGIGPRPTTPDDAREPEHRAAPDSRTTR